MKIILHGKLARLFGSEHFIDTAVPADAIEGLSRQHADWPSEMMIDAVGYGTRDRLFHPTIDKEIHLVPALCGGGAIGKIIIGAAAIAAAFIPGVGPLVSAALISVGTSLVMAGVMQLFMKAPTISKSGDVAASKYFGVDKNTTESGTYRTLAWGTVQVSGHWLSLQVDAKTLIRGNFPA